MEVKLTIPVADLSKSVMRLGKDYGVRKIVLTEYQTVISGWTTMHSDTFEDSPIHSILYLGECKTDGDMFVVHAHIESESIGEQELIIYICKGYFEE